MTIKLVAFIFLKMDERSEAKSTDKARYTHRKQSNQQLITLPARVKLAIFWKLDWQINWLTFPQELILAFWIIKNFHKDENKRFSQFEHMNSIYLNRDAPNLANKRPR